MDPSTIDVDEIRSRVFECADCEQLFYRQPMWFCYVCNKFICLPCQELLEDDIHCFRPCIYDTIVVFQETVCDRLD